MSKPKTHISVTALTTIHRKNSAGKIEAIAPGVVAKLPAAEAEDLIERKAAVEYTGPARAKGDDDGADGQD